MKRRTRISAAIGTIIGGAGLSAVAIAFAAAPTQKSVDARNTHAQAMLDEGKKTFRYDTFLQRDLLG